MKRGLLTAFFASLTVLPAWHHALWAQSMVDPTRPPASLNAEGNGERNGPVLQSILITARSRSAVIDGQRIELGGSVGAARVSRIDESEVVLRSAGGTEVLRLYPDVQMKPVKTTVIGAGKARRERN